jgi:putative transposase
MRFDVTVPEAVALIKKIQEGSVSFFEMIRVNVKEAVGLYLSGLMDAELSHFLGRERYQRTEGKSNHRNGSYPRGFTLKGVGEVSVSIPRDRKGEFKTQVIPRSKQYEDTLGRIYAGCSCEA